MISIKTNYLIIAMIIISILFIFISATTYTGNNAVGRYQIVYPDSSGNYYPGILDTQTGIIKLFEKKGDYVIYIDYINDNVDEGEHLKNPKKRP